jgi:hypothetical protein
MYTLGLFANLAFLSSSVVAGCVGFFAAKRRGRRKWPWGVASAITPLFLIVLVQLGSPPQQRRTGAWVRRGVLATSLLLLAAFVGNLPLQSEALARFEASTAARWFASHTILAEGPDVIVAAGAIRLRGEYRGPVTLAGVGLAFGVLILTGIARWPLLLAALGFVLGGVAELVMTLQTLRVWIDAPSVVPPVQADAAAVACLALAWAAVAAAFFSVHTRGPSAA